MAGDLIREVKALSKNEGINKRLIELLGAEEREILKNSVIEIASSDQLARVTDAESVWQCAMKSATLKLPVNPAFGYVAFVPRAKKEGGFKATFQPMVKGLWTLAMRSGRIKRRILECVYEGELLRRRPFDGIIEFSDTLSEERGKPTATPIGYYAKYILKDGFEDYVYMTHEECEAWRDRYSEAYKKSAYRSKWYDSFDEMAKKTCLGRLLRASDLLNVADLRVLEANERELEEDIAESTGAILDTEIVEKKAKGRKIQPDDFVEAETAEKSPVDELAEAFGED